MADGLLKDIKENLQKKTDEELIEIWVTNNKDEWSPLAFRAVKEICTSRNISLPEQNTQIIQKPESIGSANIVAVNNGSADPGFAAFGTRAGANILNSIFMIFLWIFTKLLFAIITPNTLHDDIYILLMPFPLYYYIFCEGIWSTTPGYFVAGIKIINESGGKISFKQAVIRAFARLIPFYYFFYHRGRVLHDELSHTGVVSRYGNKYVSNSDTLFGAKHQGSPA